jgi:hypothetical protein
VNTRSENIEIDTAWICPACGKSKNSQGEPLLGSRAAALHVAGKIRGGDSLHRSWAVSRVGDINKPSLKRSINTLADALEWAVAEDNRIRRDLEDQRIRRLSEEKQAERDPNMQAIKYIIEIEKGLHQFVRSVLEEAYGEGDDGWWAKGVPTQIRVECAKRQEEDPNRRDKYSYTFLIDLKTTIAKKWNLFEPYFKKIWTKTEMDKSLIRLNILRDSVFHVPSEMKVSDDDLSFLRSLLNIVQLTSQKV